MILVDFNHLNSRILHSSIATLRPKKKNGKYITESYTDPSGKSSGWNFDFFWIFH